jgi:uncharacterized protein
MPFMKNSIDEDAVEYPKRRFGNRLLRATRRVVRPVLIAYLFVLLAMTFVETWLVYPIPPAEHRNWDRAAQQFEQVWFAAEDGTKLYGWFAPQPDSKRAVLYCHGNGEDVGDNGSLLEDLRRELEASVFLFDYRGYGRSDGKPTEAGCIADGLAAQRWLADRMGLKTADVVVMGRSLGGGVAVAVAAEKGAQALVLDSTFSRMTDAAAYHYPWLPVRLLMRNRYDSIARIRKYSGPLFQSHGTADSIVPIEFARQLFAASPSKTKQFREYEGRDHNDSIPRGYLREVSAFLDGPLSTSIGAASIDNPPRRGVATGGEGPVGSGER